MSADASERGTSSVDVAIVGAGIAGAGLAAALTRTGFSAALIAARDRHPREFRAEKFGEGEMALFDAVGLGGPARGATTAFDGVCVGLWGQVEERLTLPEYATRYPDLVDALRAALPSRTIALTGRVETVETGPSRQRITLADGRRLDARLLVVATGLGEGLHRKLGIARVRHHPDHALAFGFTLTARPEVLAVPSLTWRGERLGDAIAYLTLFPLGEGMRANLFTYWTPGGPEARAFLDAPAVFLAEAMPGLTRRLGPLTTVGPVEQRPIDLMGCLDPARDGVVVVGDAFLTVCPTTGTGIRKALTDVDRLAAHIPDWFATPGMGRAKIAAFYADPVKQACDAHSLRLSLEGRRLRVDASPGWKARRLRSFIYRRLRGAIRGRMPWTMRADLA